MNQCNSNLENALADKNDEVKKKIAKEEEELKAINIQLAEANEKVIHAIFI